MAKTGDYILCDGCGLEFSWSPVVDRDKLYCCEDCHQGLLCKCGERMEMEDDRRGSADLPVV